MKIKNVSQHQQSFGDLVINIDLQKLKPESKEFVVSQIPKIKDVFAKNKFDKKRWTDVILTYDNDNNRFYGIISSKKEGVPYNPHYKHAISTDKKVISSFKKWLNEWNHSYSPKVLKKIREIEKTIFK